MSLWRRLCASLALAFLLPTYGFAHSVAGKRLFPTIFQIEDPSPSDEASVLAEQGKEREDGQTTIVSSLDAEYAKRITEDFGIMIGWSYRTIQTGTAPSQRGFGNIEAGIKYQVVMSEEHEAIVSVGITDEIGNTGNSKVSDDFSTVSPTLYFGKGFGDVSEAASLARPLAVTGIIAANLPTRSSTVSINPSTGDQDVTQNPSTLSWGISIQYSLFYLQSFVRDVGLPAPLDRMVLVIEAPLETCLNRGCDGRTTGTVNPGVVWIGKRVELGLAATIPVNQNSGTGTGFLALFHVFIDDLLPRSLGRPLVQ